jgi:hypothetical protein
MTVSGAVIMGFFATIWWIVGMRAAGHAPGIVYLVPLTIAIVLGAAARRVAKAPHPASDAADQARRDRLVGWASAGEGLALFLVAGIVLPSTGHREATVSAVALIVGVHFLPLARWLPAPRYYLTAVALMALGAIGLWIPEARTRITLVSAGAAIVLWATAAAALRRAAREQQLRVEPPVA